VSGTLLAKSHVIIGIDDLGVEKEKGEIIPVFLCGFSSDISEQFYDLLHYKSLS